jgi:hypothetical protein
MRQGASLETALGKYPEYRAQLRALLEVASLIRPLAKDVVPSPALRKAIRASLTEPEPGRNLPLFNARSERSGTLE